MQLMSKGYPESLIELKLSVEEKVLLKNSLRQLKKEKNKLEGMVHLINLRLDLDTGLLFSLLPLPSFTLFFVENGNLDRQLVPKHTEFLVKVSIGKRCHFFPCDFHVFYRFLRMSRPCWKARIL